MSTRFYTQSAKVDLNLYPRNKKTIEFPLSSSKTYMWSLKVIGQTMLSIVPTGFYTQSAKVDFDLSTNRVPPLIIHNLHMKFESDWANNVVYRAHKVLYTECQSWPWPLTTRPEINRFLLLSSTTYRWIWKWSGKNCSLHPAHKAKRDRCMHPFTHPTIHERLHYYMYIPFNIVANPKT